MKVARAGLGSRVVFSREKSLDAFHGCSGSESCVCKG